MRTRFFCIIVCLFASLYAKKAPIPFEVEVAGGVEIEGPWFTGPLLAPSGMIIPAGHYDIEPYVYAFAYNGHYNKHWNAVSAPTFLSIVTQSFTQIGLSSWCDFHVNPSMIYNYTEHEAKWGIGDLPVVWDIQLYHSGKKVTDWHVGIKLSLRESIPLGKYQNLNPKKHKTDLFGSGSWESGVGLVWGNLFYLGSHRFMSLRIGGIYTLPAPVHVKNFNAYGGGKGTRGKVFPGQIFEVDIGSELSLSQNWAFALDLVGRLVGHTRFKGKTVVPNTTPSSIQFSMAPAIEYNWSGNLGIIFGPWFTLGGRNSVKFASGVIAFNYYH